MDHIWSKKCDIFLEWPHWSWNYIN